MAIKENALPVSQSIGSGDYLRKVSSGGVSQQVPFSAVKDAVVTVDSAIDSDSENPVQNKAIAAALDAAGTQTQQDIASAIQTEVTDRNAAIASAIDDEETARNTAISEAVAAETEAREAADEELDQTKANIDGYYPDLYAGGLTTGNGTVDEAPYLSRTSPSLGYNYNRESGVIVGGTVNWNQLIQNGNFADGDNYWRVYNGVKTVANNVLTLTSNETYLSCNINQSITDGVPTGHKYVVMFEAKTTVQSDSRVALYADDGGNKVWKTIPYDAWGLVSHVRVATTSPNVLYLYGTEQANTTTYFRNVMLIDLTAMFNPTIADYVYNLEQSTSGSGIAWLRSYGFLTEDYYPYSQPTLQSVQATAHKTYDGDGNVIGNYALDSNLTLRGIPKLDASNNLYYDGDTYESDGTVTRKYVEVDLATLAWSTRATGDVNKVVSASTNAIGEYNPQTVVGISDKYPYVGKSSAAVLINTVNTAEKGFYFYNRGTLDYSLYLVIPKDETPSGSIVFSVATPTTETADPYTNPQIVDPDGTEEYVTANNVPVGHETLYIEDLKSKLEDMPDIPEAPAANGTYTLQAVRSNTGVTYSWVSN